MPPLRDARPRWGHVQGNGRVATVSGGAEMELDALNRQIAEIERRPVHGRPFWPWIVVVLGLAVVASFGTLALNTYRSIELVNTASFVQTGNPLELFATQTQQGIQVPSQVDARIRQGYRATVELYVLAGTALLMGFVVAAAGVFLALNL